MDLDNNEYPDLLVGAYESNNAVFLKSAPVVHLDSQIQFLVAGKQVDLNNKNCRIRDGTQVPCVDVEVTVEYDGVGVPDTIGKGNLVKMQRSLIDITSHHPISRTRYTAKIEKKNS